MALQTAFLLAALAACTASAAVGPWNPNCIKEPVGFGKGTVGGNGGAVVVPKNNKELKDYLYGDTPRIIMLQQTFDFTGTEGTAVREGCYFKKCGQGFQYALKVSDTCEGREKTDVTVDVAGLTPLTVGSYKTIMGVNGKGAIRGKGLKIGNAKQVIIRDISIVDINPAVIWGGDALAINGVDQAWIHNVTFKNIGRQFLVTYQTSNTGITISSCTFDGNTPNSAFCDGKHYWVWLFWGTDDRITMINNRVINTSGRLPHAGGYSTAKSYIHIVGNYFENNSDVAIEPWTGSHLLVEGNEYTGMRRLVNTRATKGFLYLVNTEQDAEDCRAAFGEPCLRNKYTDTETVPRSDKEVLLRASKLGSMSPVAVNEARQATCITL